MSYLFHMSSIGNEREREFSTTSLRRVFRNSFYINEEASREAVYLFIGDDTALLPFLLEISPLL